MKEIALVGNPNCGKTTLFNALTGNHQRVGNWTGVTNEIKKGLYKKDKRITVVDLPGIYSFRAGSVDVNNAYNYIIKSAPNAIINVVDGTNLSRNLYLTLELINLKIPTVIAVNMCDELDKNGIKIDYYKLSKLFNIPVIPVSALKNKNLNELIKFAIENKNKPSITDVLYKSNSQNLEKRIEFVEDKLSSIVTKKQTRNQVFTQKLDNVLMNATFGIPIFFILMTLVYFLAIKIGGVFGSEITFFFDNFTNKIESSLYNKGVSVWLISLICDAILHAIGGITSFLPQILILFILLALIEDSGYAARATFLFDGFFTKFGLSGKSLLPMMVSCGCTVTGLLSSRTIEGVSARRMTIFLSPFMPCGAKSAVFAWFSSVLFNGNALIASSMYFLGIVCVGVFGNVLKRFKAFSDEDQSFVLEIPTLRLPSIKNVFSVMWEKVKEFTTKAGFAVFTVSVFLWLLKNIGVSGYVGENVEKSFLYLVGDKIKYIFYPLGFSSWQTSVALLSGIFAKEAVIETLELVCYDVTAIFPSTYTAYAFMAFILLSPPCIAALSTAKNELNSTKWFLFMCLFQFCSAYIVALTINFFGFMFTSFGNLILSVIIVIIVVISLIYSILKMSNGCSLCHKKCKGGAKCHKREKRFTI